MKPFIIFMVGISGSGKTTISKELEKRLRERGMEHLQFIDGDVIRDEFGGIFGYTFEERMRNNRAVCVVSSYLLRNDISVILAQVGAYQKMREQVRSFFPTQYIEVYVKCSVEECARRDVKGYYKKLENGEMENLNGSNDTYEIPQHSDVVVDTEKLTVGECVEEIIRCLEAKGYGV